MLGKETCTIIIVNYNNARFLHECLESVFNQTCNRWKILFIDDASTDTSLQFLCNNEKYFGKLRLMRNKENIGYTKSLINAFNSVDTDIVGILDSDDALAPDAIEKVFKMYDNGYKGFVYTNFWYCDKNLSRIRSGYCKQIPDGKFNLDINGVSHFKTFRISEYNKTEGLDPDMTYGQDKDLTYKMEEVCKLHFINEMLYYHRKHGSQIHADMEKTLYAAALVEQAKDNARLRRLNVEVKRRIEKRK